MDIINFELMVDHSLCLMSAQSIWSMEYCYQIRADLCVNLLHYITLSEGIIDLTDFITTQILFKGILN